MDPRQIFRMEICVHSNATLLPGRVSPSRRRQSSQDVRMEQAIQPGSLQFSQTNAKRQLSQAVANASHQQERQHGHSRSGIFVQSQIAVSIKGDFIFVFCFMKVILKVLISVHG